MKNMTAEFWWRMRAQLTALALLAMAQLNSMLRRRGPVRSTPGSRSLLPATTISPVILCLCAVSDFPRNCKGKVRTVRVSVRFPRTYFHERPMNIDLPQSMVSKLVESLPGLGVAIVVVFIAAYAAFYSLWWTPRQQRKEQEKKSAGECRTPSSCVHSWTSQCAAQTLRSFLARRSQMSSSECMRPPRPRARPRSRPKTRAHILFLALQRPPSHMGIPRRPPHPPDLRRAITAPQVILPRVPLFLPHPSTE